MAGGKEQRREGCRFQHHGQRRSSGRGTVAGKWRDSIPFLHLGFLWLHRSDGNGDDDVGQNDRKWNQRKHIMTWQKYSRKHKVKCLHIVDLIFMTVYLPLFWEPLAIQLAVFSRKGIILVKCRNWCAQEQKGGKKNAFDCICVFKNNAGQRAIIASKLRLVWLFWLRNFTNVAIYQRSTLNGGTFPRRSAGMHWMKGKTFSNMFQMSHLAKITDRVRFLISNRKFLISGIKDLSIDTSIDLSIDLCLSSIHLSNYPSIQTSIHPFTPFTESVCPFIYQLFDFDMISIYFKH